LLDNRRTLTIGLTLLIGLTFDDLVSKLALPPGLKMTFASSVLTAVAFALLLSVVFRIGIKRSIGHQWTPDAGAGDLCAFIEDCGRQWGARADLIRRAREFLEEFSEASRSLVTRDQPVEIRADYDDVSLRLELVWRGRAVPTDGYIPTLDSLEGDADVAVAIALMRHRADRVSFTTLDSHTQRAVAILDE
jgi:NCS2 family nucleobase:cation symporter-2